MFQIHSAFVRSSEQKILAKLGVFSTLLCFLHLSVLLVDQVENMCEKTWRG